MKLAFLFLVFSAVLADAQIIGMGTTHLMFSYHGEPLFCPREVITFEMITCLDGDLKYVICRVLPSELGYIDCGHRMNNLPDDIEVTV